MLGMALGAVVASAQSGAPATPTLRISTRLVLLDTNVVDAQGRPVTGLTAKDFAVYEDKRQEQIVSFEAPEAHVLPPGDDAATVFDPGKPAAFGSSAVTIFVLDEVNTHFADSAYAVHSIEAYLAKEDDVLAQPATLMVVRDSRFQQLVGFTLDKQKLLGALRRFVPEQAWALEQSMSVGEGVAERLDRSLAALEQLAQYGARIPGRKNLMWVGAGFPSIDPQALTEGTHRALANMLQHVTDVLLENRVTLFAVDPTTTAASLQEITDPVQLAFVAAVGTGGKAMDPFDHQYDFDRLGPVTGGKVLRGLNDVDRQLRESIASGGNYYTLGYRPSNGSEVPGQFRHISIVCLRPGLVATTHDGYYTSSPKATLATDTIGYDLNNAATASIPFHGVSFTADRGPAGAFVLHVQARDLTWVNADDKDAKQEAQVEVLAVALSAKGKVLEHQLLAERAVAAQAVDTRAPAQSARFTVSLTPPAGAQTLRLVVRDTASGRMGTLDFAAR